jgi:exodeoxyribonuclease VII large subunit
MVMKPDLLSLAQRALFGGEPGATDRAPDDRAPGDRAPGDRGSDDRAPAARQPPARGLPARRVYSVTRLNREVRSLLESGIGRVWVQGEISNLSRPSSGHWYFSLKDRDAQLRCAMFRARNSRAPFTPVEGQLVVGYGQVSLFEQRGEYQLVVEQLEHAGLGALQRAFEELKTRLAAEGLFATERKRPLPAVPRRIGVITSPTGAALRDILHILARRFPAASILVYPTAVQGAAAVPAIVAALDLASARSECDVLILARGGGSLEDLWAFNDERIARAIDRCRVRCRAPIVTGIGHEIDFTIADFVADVRAPTPSGAAELVVPDRRIWLHRLEQICARFGIAMRRSLGGDRARLQQLRARCSAAMRRSLASERASARALLHRLESAHPGARLNAAQARLAQLDGRLRFALQTRLTSSASRVQGVARALQAVSPLATLERGFAVVTRSADGALVTSSEQLAVGERFDARLASGSVHATVLARRP